MLVEIGKLNQLKVLREVEFGFFLDGDEDGEILLPRRYCPEVCIPGEVMEVFICHDSEDRLMATTETPFVMVDEIAILEVVAISPVGAFLDWGLPKDLFLPFAEQNRPIKVGDDVLVAVYLDKSDRLAASMRIEKFLAKSEPDYKEGQAVELVITAETDLGYKALIEGRHWGILYRNEVFQPLKYAQQVKGFIKKLREDGKIDLSLPQPAPGHKAAVEDIAPKILEQLVKEGGFLPIHDKTSAEDIYQRFGVSKKKYKIALGGLYKSRMITVEDDGIRLVKDSKS